MSWKCEIDGAEWALSGNGGCVGYGIERVVSHRSHRTDIELYDHLELRNNSHRAPVLREGREILISQVSTKENIF